MPIAITRYLVDGGVTTWVQLCPASVGVKVYITNGDDTDALWLRFAPTMPLPDALPDAIIPPGETWEEDVERYSGAIWGASVGGLGSILAFVADFGIAVPAPEAEANPCGEPGDDLPKMEGRYTVPAAGLRMTANYNGGGEATLMVLVAGVTYWPTAWSSDSNTFTGTIAAVLNVWLGGDIELTIDDDGDEPTGKVTIAATDTFTVAWPDPELAELLGFDPDTALTGANTYTGTSACRNVWLPDRRRWLPPDPEGSVGRPVPNTSMLISPSGHSVVLDFGSRYATTIEFHFIAGSRARKELEVVPNESFQSFFERVIAIGEPVRYHYDRSDDLTFVSWRVMPVFLVAPDIAGWTGIGCAGAEAYYGIGPLDVVEYRAP